MRQYNKIDLFFDGDYLCSSTQFKAIKACKASLLNNYREFIANPNKYGFTRVQIAMYKLVLTGPELLKGRIVKS